MSQFLCITIRFLDPVPTFRGRCDGGEPEWPPSPLRLFQAIVDAAASQWRETRFREHAQPLLEWLERLDQPEVVAPTHTVGRPFRIAVPNNDLDVWAGPISLGNEPKKQPNELKTMKQIRPVRFSGDSIHYLFTLPGGPCTQFEILQTAVRSITHLGWGIDMAVGEAFIIPAEVAAELTGTRWSPSTAGNVALRVPKQGTLSDLTRKHTDFLNRVSSKGFRPVPPLRAFNVTTYRRATDPVSRPQAVFKLVDDNDDTVAYPQSKLIHIAGMVKHAAIELMRKHPPADLRGRSREEWLAAYVSGHQSKADKEAGVEHTQFSYVPLQTVNPHNDLADPAVRRVMVVAPLGDDAWLEHLARRLDGAILKPLPNTTLPPGTRLERIADRRHDGVREAYTRTSRTWASTTPVILPGHDDHKPEKTRRLILKALQQSGIDQPCTFEWSAFSPFRKMLGAHKYVKDAGAPDGRRRINYVRPDHLLDLTGVHLTLTFEHDVPGPITLGAGRHCGFGLMAAMYA